MYVFKIYSFIQNLLMYVFKIYSFIQDLLMYVFKIYSFIQDLLMYVFKISLFILEFVDVLFVCIVIFKRGQKKTILWFGQKGVNKVTKKGFGYFMIFRIKKIVKRSN
jgi:hypothetical protein